MKANELRIGNFVQSIFHDENSEIKNFYNVCKICNISEQGISANRVFPDDSTSYTGSFEPIPLTEEWLLRFGFKKKMGFYEIRGKRSKLMLVKSTLRINLAQQCITEITYGDCYAFNLSSVHQLQNLYFALTGEELTIKE